jgi:hypothetical protein
MFTIRLAAVLLAVAFVSPAFGQARARFQANIQQDRDPLVGALPGIMPLMPGGGSPESYDGSGRQLDERRRMMESRRAAEKERRDKSRQMTAAKVLSEEDLAKSKFNLAHMLWVAGRIDSAKLQLSKLLDDYPSTESADRARMTLARL